MDARTLDVLHNTRDEDLLAVANGVDLQLLAHDVTVDQHRRIDVDLDGGLEIMTQTLLVGDDLHGAAAQHVTRRTSTG